MTTEQTPEDAAAEVDRLEEAVREGNESVKPSALSRAREALRFAELRRQAAERKAAREAHAQRQATADQLMAALGDDGEGTVRDADRQLRVRVGEAREALSALLDAAQQQADTVADYRARADEVADLAPEPTLGGSLTSHTLRLPGHGTVAARSNLEALSAALAPSLGRVRTDTPNGHLVQKQRIEHAGKWFE